MVTSKALKVAFISIDDGIIRLSRASAHSKCVIRKDANEARGGQKDGCMLMCSKRKATLALKNVERLVKLSIVYLTNIIGIVQDEVAKWNSPEQVKEVETSKH